MTGWAVAGPSMISEDGTEPNAQPAGNWSSFVTVVTATPAVARPGCQRS